MSERYTFKSNDFYALLDRQQYRCPLTGRELTPQDTVAEHIVPLKHGGGHEFRNIYLVNEMAAKLKRYYTEEQILQLARDIVNTIGGKYGIRVHSTRIPRVGDKRKGKKSPKSH